MKECILIADRYRLRRLDEKNMILEEFRMPTRAPLNGSQGKTEPDWYAMNGSAGNGPFFPTVGSALVWLLNHRMVNDPGEYSTLKDAIEHMERIASELREVRVDA